MGTACNGNTFAWADRVGMTRMVVNHQGIHQAFSAFLKAMIAPPCSHPLVGLRCQPEYCPDCGNAIRLYWLMARCRDCGAKRISVKTPEGSIHPAEKYCRHCGASEFRVLQYSRLETQDLLYGVAIKSLALDMDVDVDRHRAGSVYPPTARPNNGNASGYSYKADTQTNRPYATRIVEGMVLKKAEYEYTRQEMLQNIKVTADKRTKLATQ